MHDEPLLAPYMGELEKASAAIERFTRLAAAPDAPWGCIQKALFEERCGGILRELTNISRRVAEISVGSRAGSGPAPDPVSYPSPSHASGPGPGPVSTSVSVTSVSRSAAGFRIPRCRTTPDRFPTRLTPLLAPGAGSPLFVVGRAAGRHRPGEVYVAARTDETGAVVCTAGPFATRADAASFVAEQFGGQGHAVRFELVFRRE